MNDLLQFVGLSQTQMIRVNYWMHEAMKVHKEAMKDLSEFLKSTGVNSRVSLWGIFVDSEIDNDNKFSAFGSVWRLNRE